MTESPSPSHNSKNIDNKVVACHDIEGNTFQVPVDQLTFRPAVYAIIIREDKILLSKQWGGYNLPGGGIDLGEPTEEALKREVKEETGFEIEIDQILHTSSSFFKLPFKNTYVHSIHLFFQCHILGGQLSDQYLDGQEKDYVSLAEWVDLTKVDQLMLYTSDNISQILKNVN